MAYVKLDGRDETHRETAVDEKRKEMAGRVARYQGDYNIDSSSVMKFRRRLYSFLKNDS